ncbi:hypothetical protein Tco_1204778 [Tanacetum coccineum]
MMRVRLCLTIAPDEYKEVDYEILDKKFPIIDWKTENLGSKPQFDESKRSEEINMNVGVHTLMTNEGLVVRMLIEKKYPLKKETLMQMLKLKLESEEESTMALELIRFIKKVLADLESKE